MNILACEKLSTISDINISDIVLNIVSKPELSCNESYSEIYNEIYSARAAQLAASKR